MKGVHDGSGSVPALPSVSPARMAVTGRENMYVYFASHAAINAFTTVAVPMASNRAAVSKSIEPARLRMLAVHNALADGDQNRAVADCSAVRLVSVARPRSRLSSESAVYVPVCRARAER